MIGELSDRFEQEDVMKPVLCMESLLLKSACGEKCNSELKSFSESVFQADFSITQLEKQLAILVDVIRVELPDVKRVTNIRTICTAMEAHRNRSMLSEVHKLLRLHSSNIQYVRKELFGDETTLYVFEILHDRKSI